MTKRRDLERHRETLADIRGVMHSLKTLAYIESRRLTRLGEAQRAVVTGIERAAADFLSFHPAELPIVPPTTMGLIVVGSERGFCRDFNQALVRELPALTLPLPANQAVIIAIGRKLHTVLEQDPRVAACLTGASVAGEVPRVLDAVVRELKALRTKPGLLALSVARHTSSGRIVVEQLLPPFRTLRARARGIPPLLTLAPHDFLTELVDQYLFGALHWVLYDSLLAEHRARVAHLESAVDRLDEELETTARRSNRLRQEELIEEIEVILLNASPAVPDIGPR